MVDRRLMALISVTAIVLSACGSSAARTAPTAVAAITPASPAAVGAGCVVGVSWANRVGRFGMWDEPAIQAAIAAAGATYVANDAMASAETQAANMESLISKGADVLIILAQDATAIEPSVASAHAHGIPVIAYDRLIDDPASLYVSFDNVEVGRQQARALLKVAPTGAYAFIQGDKGDPNSDLVRTGQDEVLAAAVTSGAIRNVGETYTDAWDPNLAQQKTEAFLAGNGNKIDAVLAENDALAGGVIAALADHQLAGMAAVSGQDGDETGLHDVALGRQTVDVWKDARELGKAAGQAAIQLCGGATVDTVSGTAAYKTPSGKTVRSILLKPVAVTRDNLGDVVEAGWITQDKLCAGVTAGTVPACS